MNGCSIIRDNYKMLQKNSLMSRDNKNNNCFARNTNNENSFFDTKNKLL